MLYMFLADGFEETEAIAPYDMIKRAGISIATVGIGSGSITGTKGITLKTDLTENEIDLSLCEGVILPGGMPGTENLYESETVRNCVDFCAENGLLIAAICAAPSVLGRMGLLKNKTAVCYPGFEDKLEGAIGCSKGAVCDGNIITAKGAGCVFPFSYEIIKYLASGSAAQKVLDQVQYENI
ncbi:MAG: DJ-1/PfpI family protein [Oscillospiraceae bacterium]|nr:DJ-1/PfpI family protein [Oscillospiraceae bacterium]